MNLNMTDVIIKKGVEHGDFMRQKQADASERVLFLYTKGYGSHVRYI